MTKYIEYNMDKACRNSVVTPATEENKIRNLNNAHPNSKNSQSAQPKVQEEILYPKIGLGMGWYITDDSIGEKMGVPNPLGYVVGAYLVNRQVTIEDMEIALVDGGLDHTDTDNVRKVATEQYISLFWRNMLPLAD